MACDVVMKLKLIIFACVFNANFISMMSLNSQFMIDVTRFGNPDDFMILSFARYVDVISIIVWEVGLTFADSDILIFLPFHALLHFPRNNKIALPLNYINLFRL